MKKKKTKSKNNNYRTFPAQRLRKHFNLNHGWKKFSQCKERDDYKGTRYKTMNILNYKRKSSLHIIFKTINIENTEKYKNL